MFPRPRVPLSLLVVLALVAAACGDDASEETSAAVTTDSGADASPTSTSAGSYLLTDTGQTAFYDADGNEIDEPAVGEPFYGQDAAYDSAQMSYTDNGDGTVTDNVTGLVWQQDPTEEGTTWFEAQDYCESLELAETDDWRTPSLKELFSISDFSTGWPYTDTDYFTLVGDDVSKDQQYWSSNHYDVDTEEAAQNQAFGVNHGTGHIKAYPDGRAVQEGDEATAAPPPDGAPPEGVAESDDAAEGGIEAPAAGSNPATKYVRCVSGDEYGSNDFIDNDDGTITDQATGLMWAQDDSGEGLDWESALELAATANEEDPFGYSDWRVPDIKELQSIVDYSGTYPAIDGEFFNITDADAYFWSSTSAYFNLQDTSYYYAWYVAFGYAVDGSGNDSHGAGAVRFDTKAEGGPAGEDPERVFNYVRLVRDA